MVDRNALSLFAFHVTRIMSAEVKPSHTRESPLVLTFGVDGMDDPIKVELWYRRISPEDSEATVWDQGRVIRTWGDQGRRCSAVSNRAGVRNEFADAVAKAWGLPDEAEPPRQEPGTSYSPTAAQEYTCR